MRRQPIPDQDDSATAKLSLQVIEERHEGDVVVAAWSRLEEHRPLRQKSHRNATVMATESFFQLKAWIKTGVSPRGAHERRTGGRWETPLSSWKTSQACERRAFFLLRATAG